jgi:hypothetical protein
VFLLAPLFSEPDNTANNGNFLFVLLFSVYGIVIAYLCELTFGIAAWIIFKRLGIRSTLAFAGAGAVMGWLVDMLISRLFLADV